MELTWLADTPQSRRRTRALRACPSCQRKKKRCRHSGRQTLVTGVSSISRNPEQKGPLDYPSRNAPANNEPNGPRDSISVRPIISKLERFVGDLNPEAAFREKLDAPNGTHLRDRVGLWVNASAQQSQEERSESTFNVSSVHMDHTEHYSPKPSSMSFILNQRFLFSLRACERLPRSTFDHLAGIYFSKVNHILPIIERKYFTTDPEKSATSVFLEQAVCLVAAKDAAAGSRLRLTANGGLLTARKFCSELYNGLVCAMEAGLEQDRLTRIRILALMSLHSEGYEGAEAASMHLCQAIHQAQTVGLHLERPNRSPEDPLAALFWCLWALDKMHASLGARPLIMADRDIGIKRNDLVARQAKSPFNVWLALSEMLSTVLSYYRPSADDTTGWETDYPSFEEVMGDNVREDIDLATLNVLELYYHAISILSCRYRPSHRSGGSRPSCIRQGSAAVRINSLIASECARDLPPLPIVPYAVSLSMGVSYQQLRSNKLTTHFDRDKTSLETCCNLLQELGSYWYSAEAMSRLGRRALRQIDEANPANSLINCGHSNLSGKRIDRSARSTENPDFSSECIPTTSYSPTADLSSEPLASAAVVSAPTVGKQPVLPSIDEQHNDPQYLTSGDGFADIDILFDDFLDLSLPTNFCDPIFFPEEPSDGI